MSRVPSASFPGPAQWSNATDYNTTIDRELRPLPVISG